MQRNFRRTIETRGNDGTTYSDGSVSIHVAIPPRARAHVPGENRIKRNWDAPWEADLPPMGVSAQQQTEIGMGRLLINFRRVRKQDREHVARYPGTGLFDVVRTVEMGVVDACDIYPLIIAVYGLAFIEQHSDTHVLQPG